jgi:hypothetical protein
MTLVLSIVIWIVRNWFPLVVGIAVGDLVPASGSLLVRFAKWVWSKTPFYHAPTAPIA